LHPGDANSTLTGSDIDFVADAPFDPGKCRELNFIDYSKTLKK
jgi:hypothetical protein